MKLGWSLVGPPMMSVYCYLFDEIMVDTGQPHMEKEVLAMAGSHGVKQVFLTHHHEDHSGNAAAIHKVLGARVSGHALTRDKLTVSYPILPYQKYIWGNPTPVGVNTLPEKINTPLGRMVPVHTPGHSKDHTLYFLPDLGIVFSGDLYLGDRIKFFRSDEEVGIQIASLKKVAALDFDTLLCAHNPRLKNGKDHILLKAGFSGKFVRRCRFLVGKRPFRKADFQADETQRRPVHQIFLLGQCQYDQRPSIHHPTSFKAPVTIVWTGVVTTLFQIYRRTKSGLTTRSAAFNMSI